MLGTSAMALPALATQCLTHMRLQDRSQSERTSPTPTTSSSPQLPKSEETSSSQSPAQQPVRSEQQYPAPLQHLAEHRQSHSPGLQQAAARPLVQDPLSAQPTALREHTP